MIWFLSFNSGFRTVSQDDIPCTASSPIFGIFDRGKVEAERLVALGVAAADLFELAVPLVTLRSP